MEQIKLIFLLLMVSSILYLISKICENMYNFFSLKAIATFTAIICIMIFNCLSLVSVDFKYIYKVKLYENIVKIIFQSLYTISIYELYNKKTVSKTILAFASIMPISALIVAIIPELNFYFINYTSFIANGEKFITSGNTFFDICRAYRFICGIISYTIFIKIIRKLNFSSSKLLAVFIATAILFLSFYKYGEYLEFNNLVLINSCIFFVASYGLFYISNLYLNANLKQEAVESVMNEEKSMIIAIDLNGFVIFINKTVLDLFKLKRYNILGESIYNENTVGKLFSETFYKDLINEESCSDIEIEDKIYKKNTNSIFKNNKVIGEMIYYVDITDEYNYGNNLKKIIISDVITNLRNRYSFEIDSTDIDKEEYDDLSLILIDLDNLKITNEVFGSEEGDEVIKTLALLIEEVFLNSEYLGYRLGGDEFCVIVFNELEKEIRKKINDLYLNASKYNRNYQRPILFSVGCASKSEKGKTVSELYKFADISLYKSKKDGKNRTTFFSDEIYKDFVLKNKIKEDFGKAVINKEFKPYIKPNFSVEKDNFDGIEILFYWNHKEFGILQQEDFYPLNYEHEKDLPIEFIMLEESLQNVKMWNEKYSNKPIEIFVKVSMKNIAKSDIVTYVADLSNKYGVEASSIVFEIREESFLNTGDNIKSNIALLKSLGIKFLIEGFGKGSANFESIELFAADYVKFDKETVESCDLNKNNRDNLELMCRLLKNYNCKIVADGVSRQEQFVMLKSFGIDYLQGSFYGDKKEFDEFEKIYY